VEGAQLAAELARYEIAIVHLAERTRDGRSGPPLRPGMPL
jgi:hypothetical protein